MNRVVELTRQLTPISDMAVLLDMHESDLRDILSDPDDDIAKAFRRTKAEVALDVRTAFIPRQGYKFIVADFSAMQS